MLFIENYCCFSIQGIIRPETDVLSLSPSDKNEVVEPDFLSLIPPMQLRRMSKPIKWGVAAVKLMQTGTWNPEISGVYIGTAYGLLQDSESFLSKMILQNEAMLNPTAFIQSTHNTVAGQIALALQTNAHNMTFVHKGHSFDQALLDVTLSINDNPIQQFFIAGGLDERTPNAEKIIEKFQSPSANISEGASLFLLSNQRTEHTKGNLVLNEFLFAIDITEVLLWIHEQISLLSINKEAKVLFLNGSDLLTGLINWNLSDVDECSYKSILGDYPTVSAAALALGVQQLRNHYDAVIIVNQYHNYWSMYVLER